MKYCLNNTEINRLYIEKQNFVDIRNEELRSAFETDRVESAAGYNRKTIKGVCVFDSVQFYNTVNEHFCAAGERLATDIISVHGYELDDIDS